MKLTSRSIHKLLITLFVAVASVSCSVAPTEPVAVPSNARFVVINNIGDSASNSYWGTTSKSSFSSSRPVEWGVADYVNNGIKTRVGQNSAFSVVVLDEPDIAESLSENLVTNFDKLTPDAVTAINTLSEKHEADVLLLVDEGRDFLVGDFYSYGYGAHHVSGTSFVHSNLMIYAIDLRQPELFFPTSLSRTAIQPMLRSSEWPTDDVFDSEAETVKLDDDVRDRILSLTDETLDWYFSELPVNPPLRTE